MHRLYFVRQEFAKAGIPKPLLPMYEGPCVPSGPGALSEQEQADLSIRDSLILQAYGVDVQTGGFPAGASTELNASSMPLTFHRLGCVVSRLHASVVS